MPFLECEGREARKAKDCTEEKRPWSWHCRTWLKEWRILVRHDATNPGFHRASGRYGGTDNERGPQRMRPAGLCGPRAAGGPAGEARGPPAGPPARPRTPGDPPPARVRPPP